jgi:hypothetical protein
MYISEITNQTTNQPTNRPTDRPTDWPTDWLTDWLNSMELSPAWEAATFAATQECLNISWNPRVHYCVHKGPPLVPILSRIERGPLWHFVTNLFFYGKELLAPHQTLNLEAHPLSAVRDCLFNIFAATLHMWRPSSPSATWGRAMPCWRGSHLRAFPTCVR